MASQQSCENENEVLAAAETSQEMEEVGAVGSVVEESVETQGNTPAKMQQVQLSQTAPTNISLGASQEMEEVGAVGGVVASDEPIGDTSTELQPRQVPQTAPGNVCLAQTNYTNLVDNRQFNLSQQTFNPHPMQVGTLIGGKHNLNLTADGHSTVNIYNHKIEEKPCHMPLRDDVGEEITGCPKGTKAIPHVHFNSITFDIIERLENNERLYRRVKWLCRSDWGSRHGIPERLLREKEPEDFIKCLEQCQLLGPHNTEFLFGLMKETEQLDLAEKIADYNKFHATDKLYDHKPNGTKANGKFHAEVVLHGDINQRSINDVNRYKDTLQERLGIPRSAANYIGCGDGSVVLVFQLPLKWPCNTPGDGEDIDVLARLKDDVCQRADWLMDSDVIGIHIEGQDFVDLSGVSPIELHETEEESLLSAIDIDFEEQERTPNITEDAAGKDVGQMITYLGNQHQNIQEDNAVEENLEEAHEQTPNSSEEIDVEVCTEFLEHVEEVMEIMDQEISNLSYIERRIDLLESHEIRYLPAMLKSFVKNLQRDIMKLAEFLRKTGHLDMAIYWYTRAINVEVYAMSAGFSPNNAQSRNLVLSRVECAIESMRNNKDKDRRREMFSQCIIECKFVLKMDWSDIRPRVLLIAAMYGQMQDCENEDQVSRMKVALRRMIESLPIKEHTNPMIKECVDLLGVTSNTGQAVAVVTGSRPDLLQDVDDEGTSKKIPKIRKKRKGKTTKKRHRKTGHSDSGFDTGNTSTGDDFPKRHGRKPIYRSATDSESGIGSAITHEGSSDSDMDALSCSYCHESFADDKELEVHITSLEHKTKLNSDKERSWNHRSPPLSVINGNYQLCERSDKRKCPFSNVSAVNNSCTMAHSTEELQEWKDRHKYRKMKMQKASQKNLFSFLDDLQLEYYLADNQMEIMAEKTPDYVQIEYQPSNLSPSIPIISEVTDDTRFTYNWTFTIKTSKHPLKRIGLLHDAYRIHFQLTYPGSTTKAQICPGDMACATTCATDDTMQYTIGVEFRARMLGRFEQWIVFDFDVKPVAFHKLVVRVGSDGDGEDLNTSHAVQPTQIWDSSNSDIVPFNRHPSRLENNLASRYRLTELSQPAGILDRDNYYHFMHEMLKTEERERVNLLKRFGMKVEMTLKHTIHLKSRNEVMTKVSESKQLFGQIDLTHALNDDTSASQIVLTGVQHVLIKMDPSSEKVYEAEILKDREMEDKQTKDELYVILSNQCVRQMGLAREQIKKVEIQFQLDRYIFLLMHQAVERMTTTDYMFPTENPNPALICPQKRSTLKEGGSSSSLVELNKWQEAAARFICSKGGLRDHAPLLLLYGPFGTGKTFTIASAVMETLRKMSTSSPKYTYRILICTHSNSAADLYLTNYFHDFMSECKAKKSRILMRRVYATSRNIRSIPSKVRPYIKAENGRLIIDASDIRPCHLVITTTSTASRLATILPKDHFSHILIDEAGQVLETEAIIPLTLAKRNTCVVLAGDHVQMGPTVYSQEARNRNFHHSLLERLFEYSSSNNCHRHIILSDNYRSCTEILKFLSEVFYHARHLQALGDQPVHPDYYPLEFREVLGEDEVLGNSYVNNFEADEIASRVKELKDTWPADLWGNFDQSKIGVLTPYTLQVRKIRKKLELRGYGDVTVERVQNVQGKEYRVVFISTVRTRNTITCSRDKMDGDTRHYLGFLSDSRQLNTAFTRAKSLVVVVGNPIALCSIGKCSTVWQRYITECEEKHSLHGDLSKDEIISAIQSLNPSITPDVCSKSNTSSSELLPLQAAKYSDAQSTSFENGCVRAGAENEESAQPSSLQTPMSMDPLMQLWKTDAAVTSSSTSDTESEDEDIRRPDLLRQFRREARKRVGEKRASDETDSEIDDSQPVEPYRMVHDDDEVVITNDVAPISEEKGAVGGDDEGTKKPLGEVKRCTFRIDFDGKKYAVPIDDPLGAEEILISTNTQRRTALDGDIVLVEVVEDPEYVRTDGEQDARDEQTLYGRVIHIEKRAVDMTYKEIVCFPDLYTDNLMVPVDRTLPKIFMLRPKADRGKKRNDQVLIIPICRFRDGKVVLHKNVNVTTKERSNKLFVVRWVSWEPRFIYPAGMVIEDLPRNTNEVTGLDILRRVYSVPDELDEVQDLNLTGIYNDMIRREIGRRADYRAQHVITIDPENTMDYDDALSIDDRADGYPPGYCRVYIHISDVTYFVHLNDEVDSEARHRATSYYPENNDPIHMLPPLLSTDICSIKKDEDRLALSLCFVVNQNGDIAEEVDPEMKSTVIRCKDQLTYDEAEEIIRCKKRGQKRTRECILRLHTLAVSLREARLGSARFASSFEGHAACTPQSHILIEEMMILANQQVAKYLLKSFPNHVPVRRQLPPETKRLREWCENHQQNIANSTYLVSEKDFLGKRVDEDLETNLPSGSTIDIHRGMWKIVKSMNLKDQNDQRDIAAILCSNKNHPQFVPAVSALHHIMRKGDYVCSGEYQNKKLAHTGLRKDIYTHFTSPVRRYIDIAVHRMVKAALWKNEPPYSAREMSDICHHSSVQLSKAKDFQLKTRALQLALQVKQYPISVHAVLESVSENNMMVGFSFYPLISEAQRRCDVLFSLLKPIGRPEVDDEKKHARLKWKERIFHTMSNTQLSKDDIKNNRKGKVELDSERFVFKVPASQWTAMTEAVDKGDMVTLGELIHVEEDQTPLERLYTPDTSESSRQPWPVVQEVTCELGLDNIRQKKHHYINFKREFAPGDVLQVQLQAGLNRGLMVPKITLVNVTPELDFCTEHRKDAVQCFAEIVDRRPSRLDIKTYQATWRPVIEMLTSYNAVYGNETILIHGVQIEWQSDRNENAAKPCGSFNLTNEFCRTRHIKIGSSKGTGLRNDYLCIRYRDPDEQLSEVDNKQPASIRDYQEATFVAHAYIIDTSEDADDENPSVSLKPGFLTVFFEVHHCSSPFPSKLLPSTDGTARSYTVEVIPKPVPDRRLERSVYGLHKAPQAIQDVCLLKPPKSNEGAYVHRFDDLDIQGSPFPALNASQKKALRSALHQPFTVIQGPPGTGKTLTGAYLVHFFTKKNSKLRNTGHGRPQVLYCGPSNKSVDVIAGYLKRFDRSHRSHKLSLVRIYSEFIEYKSFPPPVEPGPERKMNSEDVNMDADLEDISLHYRIRRAPNSYAEVITAFETKFGLMSDSTPSDQDLCTYYQNKERAEREELSRHQVILCTCNTSGQYRVRRNTNIMQCIVDEAGMCNEPETLIPLVATKPKQIVLVGDHKQLRPIIQENTAQQLGMDISLLERYSKKMEMLDTQYRMHTAICDFPSHAFYEGKLITDKDVTAKRRFIPLRNRWPGGEHHPMVFCHTVGREETLSVHTEEGNEMSKSNNQEVYQVVRIARTLVNHYKVKPEHIVILTQYQLQRKKIELSLTSHKRERAANINVRTVIKSQGSEWDFVIMSTVRSLPRIEIEENPTLGWRKHNLGFIADDHQMNVAITRARKGLIIVGNKYLLQTDKRWNELLEYYSRRRCVVEVGDFLPKKK